MLNNGRGVRRLLAMAAAFALVGACSGGGLQPSGSRSQADKDFGDSEPSSGPSERVVAPGAGSRVSGTSVSTPTGPSGPLAGGGLRPIFGPAEDRIGITSTTINLCIHAPLDLLPLVGVPSKDDFDVYWQWLTDHGGLNGRNVQTLWTNDQNTQQGAQQALEECRRKPPFAVISGTVDAEILDAARVWAERTHTLYYFNFASELPARSFSYSPFASIETIGRRAAEWILTAHQGKRIGLVYRQSPSFDPGAKAFVATLAARHTRPVVEVGTVKDQANYRDQIGALKGRADVVFVVDDPIATTELLKQARAQGYAPQWLLMSAFNFTTDTLGSDAVSPHPIEAITALPPYRPGSYEGPYARYGDEVRRYEDAFRQYQHRPASSDVAWIFWSWWRVMGEQLQRCGRDCTRNRLLSVQQWNPDPFCSIRFRDRSNFGSTKLSIARAYAPAVGLAAWAEVPGTVCQEHF